MPGARLAPKSCCILEAGQGGGYWRIRAEEFGETECSDDAFDDVIQLSRLKGAPADAQLWIASCAKATPENGHPVRLRQLVLKLKG